MWNLIGCYLLGQHEYDVRSEPGTMFLKCAHCGRRSAGWVLDEKREAARARADRAHAEAPAHQHANEHAR